MKKLILIALATLPIISFAQNHHEVGLVGGVSGYKGDLAPHWIPHEKAVMPTAGVMYKYFWNPHMGLRANLNVLQITAADSLSHSEADRLRNLSFTNRMIELQVGLEVNLLPIEVDKFKFTPYAFAGVAGFYSNPWAYDLRNEKVFLRDLGTEGQGLPTYPDRKVYSTIQTSFPIGIGVKGFVGKTVMVTGEIGLRYAHTDYIDDVSRTYVNLDTLAYYYGDKSKEMSFRGDELREWDNNNPTDKHRRGDYQNNDWYWSATIGFTVYFEAFGNRKFWKGSKCPRVFGWD